MDNKIENYRRAVELENKRINERLTVLSQFHGLLFTALALGWEKNGSLIYLLSIVGVLSSVAIARSLHNAESAIYNLFSEYILIPKKEKDSEGPAIAYFPAHNKSFLFYCVVPGLP